MTSSSLSIFETCPAKAPGRQGKQSHRICTTLNMPTLSGVYATLGGDCLVADKTRPGLTLVRQSPFGVPRTDQRDACRLRANADFWLCHDDGVSLGTCGGGCPWGLLTNREVPLSRLHHRKLANSETLSRYVVIAFENLHSTEAALTVSTWVRRHR